MRGVVLALVLGGCATAPRGPGPVDVLTLTALGLEFPEPGEGVLTLVVPTSRTDVATVSWELALDGRTFATGVEARVGRTEGGEVSVRAPLAWKHLGWREGSRFIDVRVRGEVRFRGLPELQRFEGRREVTSQGGPVLDSMRE